MPSSSGHRTSSASSRGEGSTRFLNVDLEVTSHRSLRPLEEAFGRRVIVLRSDRNGRLYRLHLELGVTSGNPDVLLRRFIRLVQHLPRAARETWNRAGSREFNLGIQAGETPHSVALRLDRATIRGVASVNGHIGITVYAPASS